MKRDVKLSWIFTGKIGSKERLTQSSISRGWTSKRSRFIARSLGLRQGSHIDRNRAQGRRGSCPIGRRSRSSSQWKTKTALPSTEGSYAAFRLFIHFECIPSDYFYCSLHVFNIYEVFETITWIILMIWTCFLPMCSQSSKNCDTDVIAIT